MMENKNDARLDDLAAIEMILQTPLEQPAVFDTYIPNIFDFSGTDKEDFTVFLLEIELFFIALAVPDTTRYTILKIMLKGDAKAFLERWEKEQQNPDHDHVSLTCIASIEPNQCYFPWYQAAISALEHKYVKTCKAEYYKWMKEQLYQHSLCMTWVQDWYDTQATMTITK